MNAWLLLALTALIPLIVGSIWYSPLLFAKPWMAAVGLSTDQRPDGATMAKNMLILYVLSYLVSFGLMFQVVHQYHMLSILMNQPGFKDHTMTGPVWDMYTQFMGTYGSQFRTYKHGAFHGTLAAIVFALPLIASCAVFEKRSVKYVLITWGFWLVNFILMGAILCHWLPLMNPLM